jgi:hypothetical protein
MNPLLTPIPIVTAKRIIFKAFLIAVSITIAVILIENSTIHKLIEFTSGGELAISALFYGFLFTSVFTTPIAIGALFVLGQGHSPFLVSVIAAIGSVIGDTLLLKIIHDDLEKDIEVLTKPLINLSLRHILRSHLLHLPLVIFGALVIASPLPDEIGISILTFAKVKRRWFYVISFILNFFGILIITSLGNHT